MIVIKWDYFEKKRKSTLNVLENIGLLHFKNVWAISVMRLSLRSNDKWSSAIKILLSNSGVIIFTINYKTLKGHTLLTKLSKKYFSLINGYIFECILCIWEAFIGLEQNCWSKRVMKYLKAVYFRITKSLINPT